METKSKPREMRVQWGINRGCIYIHVHNDRQAIPSRGHYNAHMVSIFCLINIS